MTGVTATPNAEATADREPSTTTTELLEVQALPPDHPVRITMHVDVLGIFNDCKTIAAFDDAMGVIVATVEGILEAFPR